MFGFGWEKKIRSDACGEAPFLIAHEILKLSSTEKSELLGRGRLDSQKETQPSALTKAVA